MNATARAKHWPAVRALGAATPAWTGGTTRVEAVTLTRKPADRYSDTAAWRASRQGCLEFRYLQPPDQCLRSEAGDAGGFVESSELTAVPGGDFSAWSPHATRGSRPLNVPEGNRWDDRPPSRRFISW
jgi:hypothetical protein